MLLLIWAVIKIYFGFILFNSRLFNIKLIASLKNMELSLCKNIFFFALVMYFGLWQSTNLFKAFLLNI